jgi:hypothetical protein
LRRPAEENENYRLDRLLERKARQGVMIYIVIYKEIELALPLNSDHTKQWLQGRHPNIFGKFIESGRQYILFSILSFSYQFSGTLITMLCLEVFSSGLITRFVNAKSGKCSI